MNEARKVDYWREAQGGFRGSHLLMSGGALLALGALLSLAGHWLGVAAQEPRTTVVVMGWLAYILGLGLVGVGFGWTCTAGILPRYGLAVAGLHVAQCLYLLYLLYGRSQPPVSPVALSAGRLLALVAFAMLAAGVLGSRTAQILGLTAGLGLVKTILRVLVPDADGGAVVDAALLIAMATGIALTAHRLRTLEDEWARYHHPGGKTDFSEFNNPEHNWNKAGDPPGNGPGSKRG